MRVIEITREEEFERMEPQWNALLRESAADTIFLTWEWLSAWWRSFGQRGELRILAVSEDNGTLRALAPLRRGAERKYGRTVPTLSFIGDGSFDSDYLDFIVARGFEEPAVAAVLRYLGAEIDGGAVLQLNEVPETSPTLAVLTQTAQSGFVWRESNVDCGTVPLPPSWDEYLGMLKPRFRTKIRSVLRTLEEREDVRFGFCRSAAEVERLLPVLFDLHTRRWREAGQPGVFGAERKRDFYAAISPLLLDRDWLRFSWLEWRGQILACQYGFEYNGVYSQLQEGYEPAAEHWNLGVGLRAWSIRTFIERGLREYDFLGGMGRHKSDWGAAVKRSKRVLLARDNFRNDLLFRRGPEWEEAAREQVKRLAPKSLLDARRARALGARPGAPAGTAAEEGGLRKVAADCYYRLGVSGVMRSLREKYHLTVGRNGHWPPVSWDRRTEPSARILYYHRVNDEHDAFSPAMPAAVFAQQMEFVAQNYKVVSLTEALARLAARVPENVVAITFDDGYQDNYINAFPILERHGLTATIFLATGGLDRREPLWFEQLAQALKNTAREFVDLEIDIPRRFWLRSEADRLRANADIYGLLRGLSDEERRRAVTALLAHLGVKPDPFWGDKMLTWDQVRTMKARGIDFGGHTVTHPFLSRLTEERAAWEVSECKRRIEQELQTPVKHFAYPSGREMDFASANKNVLQIAGYEAAVTTIWGMNFSSTDRMELRRGQPWEENPALFAYKFDWYQLVNG